MNRERMRYRATVLIEAGQPLEVVAKKLGLEYDRGTETAALPGLCAATGDDLWLFLDSPVSPREMADAYADCYIDEEGDHTVPLEVDVWQDTVTVVDGRPQWSRAGQECHIALVHPVEPPCEATIEREHQWSDDHDLVGGCEESPGLRGGPGMTLSATDVCVCCGLSRVRTSGSQPIDTLHDHERLEYGTCDVSVERLAAYHGSMMPDGLESDSPLALAMRDDDDDE